MNLKIKDNYKFSIVIRTYNEEKWIGEVLKSIYSQTYKDFEVIIVDSESTDQTLKICKEYDCKIVSIKKEKFNYSYASNVGAENAKGDIICYLSGHSVVATNEYLSHANELFNNNKIGAAYGEVIALPDGSIIEKIFNNYGYAKSKKKGLIYENEIHPGILSCSNAMIRKSEWKKNKFKEALGRGGEDVEMAYSIIKGGYEIVRSPKLLVKHSHGNGILKFINEFKNWRIMYKDVLDYIEVMEKN